MVTIVKKNQHISTTDAAPETDGRDAGNIHVPEPRFPRAAIDYIDALLNIQRKRFERERAVGGEGNSSHDRHFKALHDQINLPTTIDVPAEADNFIGTGWSDLGQRRDGTAFRWMGRVATLMVPVNLEKGAQITIEGCGFSRKKYLKALSVWIEDHKIEGTLKRIGFNRWKFSGEIAAMPWRPYSVLRIQTSGQSRLAVGVDKFVSVNVSRVTISGMTQ